jgi:hypothetical protein
MLEDSYPVTAAQLFLNFTGFLAQNTASLMNRKEPTRLLRGVVSPGKHKRIAADENALQMRLSRGVNWCSVVKRNGFLCLQGPLGRRVTSPPAAGEVWQTGCALLLVRSQRKIRYSLTWIFELGGAWFAGSLESDYNLEAEFIEK